MSAKIEVFYTGGGIWLAEANLGDNKYAVVNSEQPEYMGVYLYEKGEDDTYYPEDIIDDYHKDNIPDDLKELYKDMLIGLAKR